MNLITRNVTLTGAALGGVIIRPAAATLNVTSFVPSLVTVWICRVTLAPPIEGDIPQLAPTLLSMRSVTPGPA